jgi:hypothetical protein
LARVETEYWSREPALRDLCELPRRIRRLTLAHDSFECTQYERDLAACIEECAPYPLFSSLLKSSLRAQQRRCVQQGDSLKSQICGRMLERLATTAEVLTGPIPCLISHRKGYNLVACGDSLFAIPSNWGPLDVRDPLILERPGILLADSLSSIRELVDASPLAQSEEFAIVHEVPATTLSSRLYRDIARRLKRIVRFGLETAGFEFYGMAAQHRKKNSYWFDDAGDLCVAIRGRVFRRKARQAKLHTHSRAPGEPLVPVLVQEDYKSFNIVQYDGLFYGVEQSDGPFSMAAVQAGHFSRLARGNTLAEVKGDIDRLVRLPLRVQKRIRRFASRYRRRFLGTPQA